MTVETGKIPRPPRSESEPKNRKPPGDENTAAQDRDTGARGPAAGRASSVRQPSPGTKAGRADARIRDALANLYGTLGLSVGGIGQMHGNPDLVAAGVNITVQSEPVIDTWMELGEEIPAVRKALESMLTSSAIATLAMGHIGMIA